MPSVSELVEDVAVFMDERVETVNAYARALIDAGLLPKSRGRAVAQVTHADIVKLLTAVALQPKIKDAAETVYVYLSIDTWFVPVPAEPHFRSSAGEWLEAMLAKLLCDAKTQDEKNDWAKVIDQEISFVSNWPEILISGFEGAFVIRFRKGRLEPWNTWCRRVVILSCGGIYSLGRKTGRSYKTGKVGL